MSVKNPLLRRYWIEFDPPELKNPPYIALAPWRFFGCGVTAFTREDALGMMQAILGREFPWPLPPIKRVIEDVDIATLDVGHVRRNMGEPIWRGIWYPKLDYPTTER